MLILAISAHFTSQFDLTKEERIFEFDIYMQTSKFKTRMFKQDLLIRINEEYGRGKKNKVKQCSNSSLRVFVYLLAKLSFNVMRACARILPIRNCQ